MEKKDLIIYCDGGSRGNPGPSASAFVAMEDNKVIHKESKFLGIETNNIAEYSAVLFAVTWFSQLNPKTYSLITVNLDSQLVERQLNGVYKTKNTKLKIVHDKIKSLITKNKLNIKFVWNYREKNHLADSLVNQKLDSL
jgi:ribonuclease HI